MSCLDGWRRHNIIDRAHDLPIASVSEECCLVYSSRASLRVREDSLLVRLMPDKGEGVDSPPVLAEFNERLMIVSHREPKNKVATTTCEAIEIATKAINKTKINLGTVIIASMEVGRTGIELVSTNTVREVAMDKIELGAGIGRSPL